MILKLVNDYAKNKKNLKLFVLYTDYSKTYEGMPQKFPTLQLYHNLSNLAKQDEV